MKARIGIMSEALVRKRILAIASGKYQPEDNEPKVWYTSLDAVSHLLNQKNIHLLRLMDECKPESLSELAELTGRKKPNLSKTLNALAEKGFVRVEKQSGNRVRPVALYTDFEIVLGSHYENKVREACPQHEAA